MFNIDSRRVLRVSVHTIADGNSLVGISKDRQRQRKHRATVALSTVATAWTTQAILIAT